MSTTRARTLAKKQVDISAFVDNVREVNRIAVRIFKLPMSGGKSVTPKYRPELRVLLVELEKTVKVLQAAAGEAPSASARTQASAAGKPAAKKDGASAAWVLDTTETMVNKGQLVPPTEFKDLMGWASRQAVWKAAESHRVFYLTYKAERYFPAFYCDPTYDRRHLEAVTKVLGDLPGGAKLQFFLTRKGSLGGDTPLQALAAGRVAKVKDVAAAFAEVPAEA
ncbi:hypothetical protein [Hydrogenophaga sp. ANAO-22]|uniref:hypothetical protein n=1 Tax=Hydrogenophaga sp. ANAO-22 TaxID=3166645 RepID=UPI0036D255DC